jgi:hypothetical protein
VTTLAGTALQPGYSDANGPAARFNNPYGLAVVGGTLYIADTSNNTIRKLVIATGVVTTLAGQANGAPGAFDAAGTSASFYGPSGLATDGTGLFVADTSNDTIRKLDLGSTAVSTLAGRPGRPGWLDGDLFSSTGVYKYDPALFNGPVGVCSSSGHLYIADTGNQVIREIP